MPRPCPAVLICLCAHYTVWTVPSIPAAIRRPSERRQKAPSMTTPPTTRERILRAADAIATEAGAGMVSLDAVAARAGISKGGLLYHFPTKNALLQALVQDYLEKTEALLEEVDHAACPNGLILALMEHFLAEWRCKAPSGGLLAALAEDPAILAPVAAFEARILARLRANATDPLLAGLIFYAMQGWRSGRLLGLNAPAEAELAATLSALRQRLGPPQDSPQEPAPPA